MDFDEYQDGPKKRGAWHIIKTIFITLAFIAVAAIIFRVILVTDKGPVSTLYAGENLRALCSADSTVEFLTCTAPEEISKQGYFSAYKLIWIPAAGEAQITVRYNDSAYDYCYVDEGYEFTFRLYRADTDEYFYPSSVLSGEKWKYNYRHFTFDGVDLTGSDCYIVMSKNDNGTETECSRTKICSSDQNFKNYKLSSAEKKSLAQ